MTPLREVDIGEAFRRGTPIDEAMRRAARAAVLAHKRAGAPLVVWRDGRVQFVSADEIEAGMEVEETPPANEPPQPPLT